MKYPVVLSVVWVRNFFLVGKNVYAHIRRKCSGKCVDPRGM